jgi:hypothetical protein
MDLDEDLISVLVEGMTNAFALALFDARLGAVLGGIAARLA